MLAEARDERVLKTEGFADASKVRLTWGFKERVGLGLAEKGGGLGLLFQKFPAEAGSLLGCLQGQQMSAFSTGRGRHINGLNRREPAIQERGCPSASQRSAPLHSVQSLSHAQLFATLTLVRSK